MSVTSSRLRHQGTPGLQAQKWVSTENTTARTIVTGTTLTMVWPSMLRTSSGRVDMNRLVAADFFPGAADLKLQRLHRANSSRDFRSNSGLDRFQSC